MRYKVLLVIMTLCLWRSGRLLVIILVESLLLWFCCHTFVMKKANVQSANCQVKQSIVFAERTKSTVYAKAVLFFCCFWCKCTYILHTKQWNVINEIRKLL